METSSTLRSFSLSSRFSNTRFSSRLRRVSHSFPHSGEPLLFLETAVLMHPSRRVSDHQPFHPSIFHSLTLRPSLQLSNNDLSLPWRPYTWPIEASGSGTAIRLVCAVNKSYCEALMRLEDPSLWIRYTTGVSKGKPFETKNSSITRATWTWWPHLERCFSQQAKSVWLNFKNAEILIKLIITVSQTQTCTNTKSSAQNAIAAEL